MSTTYIAPWLRQLVTDRARHRCEYCLSQEIIIGMPFEIEHIIPEVAGGHSNKTNLGLACPRCNRYKGILVNALDEETNEIAPLFNPRQERWDDHFLWQQGGLYIAGSTPSGRVTVFSLQMNNPFVVRARRVWVESGWHPPQA